MIHAAEGSTASRVGSTDEGRVRSPDAAPFFDLFHTGHADEAKALVKAHHYSGLTPNNVVVVGTMHEPGGLFGDSGPVMAAPKAKPWANSCRRWKMACRGTARM